MSAKVIQLMCSRDKSFHLLGSYQLFSNTLSAKQTNKTAHKERVPSSGHSLKFPRNQNGRPNVSPPQDWPQRGGREGRQ